MADKKEEIEAITLLLNVEKEASLLVDEALQQAEKRISDAKTTANAEFQKKYNQLVEKMEAEYNQKVTEVQENHVKLIDEYKSSLETRNQNKEVFNSFVESVFFPSDSN